MGFNKFVAFGENFELYEYEKDLPQRFNPNARTNLPRLSHKVLGVSRKDSLSEAKYAKRRDNIFRVKNAFRRLISANLGELERPLLVTFTYRENETSLNVGYSDFNAFVRDCRYHYGKGFKYICVPEFQSRGAVHFHALFWGLPVELLAQERQTRELARFWGKGFVFLKPTDGNERLSSYLAKYMAKAFTDFRLKNQKSYVCSRNMIRPVIGSGFESKSFVLDEWGVDNSPILEKTFMTQWLGKGRYRLYKLIK